MQTLRLYTLLLIAAATLSHSTSMLAATLFGPPTTYSTGAPTYAVAVADLNGDGSLDLVVTNNSFGDFRSTVSVFMGNGDGTFESPATYKVGPRPSSVAVGDFNSDGQLDLAVASDTGGPTGYGMVTVLLGNGDGTFQPGIDYSAGHTPYYVVTGDFNHDGRLDLAVTNPTASAKGYVAILLGNGNGSFQKPAKYSAGGAPTGLTVGDFNGDGNPDLAASSDCLCRAGAVSVLLGREDGTFQPAAAYKVLPNAVFLASGDLNGDGILDLVAAQANSDSVSVLMGRGDGTFQSAESVSAGKAPFAVAIADLNGDGIPDVAVSDETGGAISVLLGRGNGAFQTAVSFKIGDGYFPMGLAVGDFNGDFKNDLAVAAHQISAVSVLLNTGP